MSEACGAVRYEIAGAAVYQNHCQCRDCQHKSGTGHGSYLTFARDGVTLTGAVKGWDITADNGNVKTRAFCPTCGSPLYVTFKAMPQFMAVHAGSLDDPSRFKPQAVTYAIRGLAWDKLDPTLQSFEKMPN
jgi:hypothetical protein